jgi:hypothetical protein
MHQGNFIEVALLAGIVLTGDYDLFTRSFHNLVRYLVIKRLYNDRIPKTTWIGDHRNAPVTRYCIPKYQRKTNTYINIVDEHDRANIILFKGMSEENVEQVLHQHTSSPVKITHTKLGSFVQFHEHRSDELAKIKERMNKSARNPVVYHYKHLNKKLTPINFYKS